jgi:predicted Rossmann fold flavoprotein
MLQKEFDVIIIGAGPAGLMAAIMGFSKGKRIAILEKMPSPALKLRISGKGRCNITNSAPLDEFITHFGKNGRFLKYAFHEFFNTDLIQFFEELGVRFKLERGGRYFPVNDSAIEIVNALLNKVKSLNIPIITNKKVAGIKKKNEDQFELIVKETKSNADASRIITKKVLLATGGKSYPKTGSDGSGYKLAERFDHTIVPPRPALVPVMTEGDIASRLEGLSLRNVRVRLSCPGTKKIEKFGEMLFTSEGLSGPVILSLSKSIIEILNTKKTTPLSIDLKPALDYGKLDQRLLREICANPKKSFKSLLKALLPQKLIPVFIDLTGISETKQLSQMTANERKKLVQLLKDFTFTVTGCGSFDQAIITAGGVATTEIIPQTMESKFIPGLYFAGEIIDIDADTGGFNLQAAFSTGWIAGRAIQSADN